MGYLDKSGAYYEGDRQGSDQEVPDRPSATHEWDGKKWVAGAKARAAAWEAIKAERDRRMAESGYLVGEHWYHSDQASRTQQLGLVLLGAAIPPGLRWKTMDGTFVPMTQTLAQQILAAAAASDQAIFLVSETHKAAAEASADPAAYDFSVGWPAGYAG